MSKRTSSRILGGCVLLDLPDFDFGAMAHEILAGIDDESFSAP